MVDEEALSGVGRQASKRDRGEGEQCWEERGGRERGGWRGRKGHLGS